MGTVSKLMRSKSVSDVTPRLPQLTFEQTVSRCVALLERHQHQEPELYADAVGSLMARALTNPAEYYKKYARGLWDEKGGVDVSARQALLRVYYSNGAPLLSTKDAAAKIALALRQEGASDIQTKATVVAKVLAGDEIPSAAAVQRTKTSAASKVPSGSADPIDREWKKVNQKKRGGLERFVADGRANLPSTFEPGPQLDGATTMLRTMEGNTLRLERRSDGFVDVSCDEIPGPIQRWTEPHRAFTVTGPLPILGMGVVDSKELAKALWAIGVREPATAQAGPSSIKTAEVQTLKGAKLSLSLLPEGMLMVSGNIADGYGGSSFATTAIDADPKDLLNQTDPVDFWGFGRVGGRQLDQTLRELGVGEDS